MKIVLNKCYGGFSLSKAAAAMLGTTPYGFDSLEKRTDPRLIALIEDKGSEFCSGDCAKLVLVEVPDTMTDYDIDEYDGAESLVYVVDGKLNYA